MVWNTTRYMAHSQSVEQQTKQTARQNCCTGQCFVSECQSTARGRVQTVHGLAWHTSGRRWQRQLQREDGRAVTLSHLWQKSNTNHTDTQCACVVQSSKLQVPVKCVLFFQILKIKRYTCSWDVHRRRFHWGTEACASHRGMCLIF